MNISLWRYWNYSDPDKCWFYLPPTPLLLSDVSSFPLLSSDFHPVFISFTLPTLTFGHPRWTICSLVREEGAFCISCLSPVFITSSSSSLLLIQQLPFTTRPVLNRPLHISKFLNFSLLHSAYLLLHKPPWLQSLQWAGQWRHSVSVA